MSDGTFPPNGPPRPNLFGLHEYDYRTSYFGGNAPLGQGAGYGIVLGMGLGFCLLIFAIMEIVKRYGGKSSASTSEDFNCGGRSVKTGLIAVDVVSKCEQPFTPPEEHNMPL